jgi:hypothetical protein
MPLLEAFIKRQDGIASSWDGDSSYFIHEGEMRVEEDAQIAKERAKAAEKLKAIINEYDL